MQRSLLRTAALVLTLSLSLSAVLAQKKPLDHSVYDGWKSIRSTSLSNDGRWVLYAIAPQEGDAVVEVRSVTGDVVHRFDRGSTVRFSQDSRFVVATVVPKAEDVKTATREKKKPEDQPKNTLLILDLQTGEMKEMPNVRSFQIADEDQGWILYRPEPSPSPTAPARTGASSQPTQGEEVQKEDPAKPKKKASHRPGDAHVLRHLSTGREHRIEHLTSAQFSEDGKTMIFALSTPDGVADGVYARSLAEGIDQPVLTGLGRYTRIAFHDKSRRVAMLTDRDDYQAATPAMALYVSELRGGHAKVDVHGGKPGVPKDWVVSDSAISFSDSGSRVFFQTAPKPVEAKRDETPEEDRVVVDIWHWQDSQMMPQQLLRAGADRSRTFQAVVHLGSDRIVQLATHDVPSVSVSAKGDGDFAIGRDNSRYERESSWNPSFSDFYLIDVRTGERRQLATRTEGNFSFSPTGRFLVGVQGDSQELFTLELPSMRKVVLNTMVPHSLFNEDVDVPASPGLYGTMGWTENDDRVLMYDAYDIWVIDPRGAAKATSLTQGVGRSREVRYRFVNLDSQREAIRLDQSILLSSFDTNRKSGGYARLEPGNPRPKSLIHEDKSFGGLSKAKNANVLAYTRQCFVEFPDLWLADVDFQGARKITRANPQQDDYLWGTAELVEWTGADGDRLQGILIKPGGFDYGKKYPMITYFYEKLSDGLHSYRAPAPSASTVNLSYFASNGYVMFVPDIPYKIGYPGESAMSAIVPGVHEVLKRGYVDPKRMGIQGQSWGGYQVTHLVTRTNMFAAACAGAPVANMFSAYSGIRWGSGLVRQFQYERGQSRIGGSMWDKPLRYLENSPVFFADKVNTPLLIMHNDKDGAVPWYQGIEMFAALRRLDKPAWLVNYNNEDHNLVQRKNRKDWSIRLSQFFDHYLKGSPAPVWIANGVPATEKGRTLGHEIPGSGG
jgi:dipeptidyl aminopeptidase/acylaminoacyl peptidase